MFNCLKFSEGKNIYGFILSNPQNTSLLSCPGTCSQCRDRNEITRCSTWDLDPTCSGKSSTSSGIHLLRCCSHHNHPTLHWSSIWLTKITRLQRNLDIPGSHFFVLGNFYQIITLAAKWLAWVSQCPSKDLSMASQMHPRIRGLVVSMWWVSFLISLLIGCQLLPINWLAIGLALLISWQQFQF